MAPFNRAVKVNFTSSESPVNQGDAGKTQAGKVYTGTVDPEWNIGNVPCGGYVLSLILESCIQYQSTTTHVDPLHITAHFLRTSMGNAPFKVSVQTLKTGKGFTNLTADLYQEDILKITTHAIFGVNGSTPDDKFDLTLKAPSPYARRLPLHTHPSEAVSRPLRPTWSFNNLVGWAYDTEILNKNKLDHPNRTNSSTVGGGGLEWGAWLTFTDKSEKLSNPYLTFLVDMFLNTPTLLPKQERAGLDHSWFPTMTLAVDFKFPIPAASPNCTERTVGLYSKGTFMNNPQARHDTYVEVWTAPSNIGEGKPEAGWRDNQICLATATQMALTVPMAVNLKNGNGKKTVNTPKL